MKTRVCPKCGREYNGYPAISRVDGKTEICGSCGTLEALEAIGMSQKDKDEILSAIQKHESGR